MILPVLLYASSLALLSVGAAGALCITLCMYQSKQIPRRAEGRARGTLNQDVASLLLLLFGECRSRPRSRPRDLIVRGGKLQP